MGALQGASAEALQQQQTHCQGCSTLYGQGKGLLPSCTVWGPDWDGDRAHSRAKVTVTASCWWYHQEPWGNEYVQAGIGHSVLGNPLSSVFLHCLFKNAFSSPPEPAGGGTRAVFSPFIRFFPVSLPDWQQGGPASRLLE